MASQQLPRPRVGFKSTSSKMNVDSVHSFHDFRELSFEDGCKVMNCEECRLSETFGNPDRAALCGSHSSQ